MRLCYAAVKAKGAKESGLAAAIASAGLLEEIREIETIEIDALATIGGVRRLGGTGLV